MLRSAVEADTEIGRRAASIMSRGALVPDEVVQKIVALRLGLEDCARGYILDGFPRTVAQADALEQMLERADQALDQVIEFTISEDELVRRITGRYVCTKCDAVYNEHSKPTQRKNICDVCGGTAFRRREDDRAENGGGAHGGVPGGNGATGSLLRKQRLVDADRRQPEYGQGD